MREHRRRRIASSSRLASTDKATPRVLTFGGPCHRATGIPTRTHALLGRLTLNDPPTNCKRRTRAQRRFSRPIARRRRVDSALRPKYLAGADRKHSARCYSPARGTSPPTSSLAEADARLIDRLARGHRRPAETLDRQDEGEEDTTVRLLQDRNTSGVMNPEGQRGRTEETSRVRHLTTPPLRTHDRDASPFHRGASAVESPARCLTRQSTEPRRTLSVGENWFSKVEV